MVSVVLGLESGIAGGGVVVCAKAALVPSNIAIAETAGMIFIAATPLIG